LPAPGAGWLDNTRLDVIAALYAAWLAMLAAG
jgi:hypothetical protein